MEKIGHDIFYLIVDQLCSLHDGNSKKLARYAVVSRQWQYALEARIFKTIKLRTYPGEFERFAQVISRCRHRIEALRELRLTCNIPEIGNTEEEHRQNQDKFFSDISALFKTLQQWEKNQPDASLPPLHLRVRCCIDPVKTRTDYSQRRAPSIRIEDFKKLPLIRRVTSADMHQSKQYTISPHTSGRLLCLMPRLEEVSVYFWDPEDSMEEWQGRRRAVRQAMTECILMIKDALPGLKSLYLDRWGWHDTWIRYSFPDTLLENGADTLCQAIRSLSSLRHLEELKLIDILLSQDLFQEPKSGQISSEVLEDPWPALKCLEISTQCVAANGQWFYTNVGKPRGSQTTSDSEPYVSDTSDESLNRWQYPYPDPTIFNPFICGLAELSLQMPKLELGFFKIRTDHQQCSLTFQWVSEGKPFETLDIGMNGVEYIGDSQSRQWRITPQGGHPLWKPEVEIMEALETWSGKGNVIIQMPCNEW